MISYSCFYTTNLYYPNNLLTLRLFHLKISLAFFWYLTSQFHKLYELKGISTKVYSTFTSKIYNCKILKRCIHVAEIAVHQFVLSSGVKQYWNSAEVMFPYILPSRCVVLPNIMCADVKWYVWHFPDKKKKFSPQFELLIWCWGRYSQLTILW